MRASNLQADLLNFNKMLQGSTTYMEAYYSDIKGGNKIQKICTSIITRDRNRQSMFT